MSNLTAVILSPQAVKRQLCGVILSRLMVRGVLELEAAQLINFSEHEIEKLAFAAADAPAMVYILSGEDALNVSCDARELVQIISNEKVNYVFIAHTHPNGSINPSKEDVLATKRLLEICRTIGVGIVDHIIFNELDYFSFKSNQILLT